MTTPESINHNTRVINFTKTELLTALSMFITAVIFYTSHMIPSVSAGDNGELTTAMHYLGIAHAPGYPLHSYLGKLFTFLPVNNVGWRANFFSVFCGGLTIFFSVLVYIKLLLKCNVRHIYALVAAVITGLAFMFSETLFSQAIFCEVYTMSAVFYPVMVLILMRWREELAAHQHDSTPFFGERFLMAYAFLFGVAMCGHQTIIVTWFFGFSFILYNLYTFSLKGRKLTEQQFNNGITLLIVMGICLFIAYFTHYYYIMRLESNVYEQSADGSYHNVFWGITPFIICNLILLAIYLYYKFLARDQLDAHNYLQKGFFTVVKMFGLFYVGFSIYTYLFIRSHGNPPINWMGISETKETMLKIGKFFNAMHRKQFGTMGKLPLNWFNYTNQIGKLFSTILRDQFSPVFHILAVVGMVKLYLKNKYWFFMVLIMFVSYNAMLLLNLRYKSDERTMFFVKVFFIFSYFTITIPMAAGISYLMEGIERLFHLKSKPDRAAPAVSGKTAE
ncbi:MAG TPA: DUF2723 domain-containing protein [Spirochaetota bacterium]|nr:DUF2723 domain-containing protein [Spirochaetota bacterium]